MLLAAFERLQQAGEWNFRTVAVIDRPVDFKPVNAGLDLRIDRHRVPEGLAIELHLPTSADKIAHRARHSFAVDLPAWTLAVLVDLGAGGIEGRHGGKLGI